MELNPGQKDALTELINIGYGRAAGALSELTGYRVTLEVPQVSMHQIADIAPMLEALLSSQVASVAQAFDGPVAGNALLLLDEDSALALSRLLTDDQTAGRHFDENSKEIITEVGNIVLNACLGVFGNLLHIQVKFSVPRLHIERVAKVIGQVAMENTDKVTYGLMVHTRFYAKAEDVSGYLVIVLGITSLDKLMAELAKWEERQLT